MAKYLFKVTYSADGAGGIMKEGGTSRRATVEKLASGVGGSVESFYFAFGEDDAFVVVDLPDDKTAAAISLTVGATGAASLDTVKLLTPEEVDEATKISVSYRPPGA